MSRTLPLHQRSRGAATRPFLAVGREGEGERKEEGLSVKKELLTVVVMERGGIVSKRRRKRRGDSLSAGTKSIPARLRILGFASYREYLASPHWAEVKLRFGEHSPRQCAACHKPNIRLALHHKTYKRLGREKMDDLVYLCDGCHQEVHRSAKGSLRGRTNRIIRSMKNINIPASSLKRWPSNPTPTLSRTIVSGMASPWETEGASQP